MYIMYANASNNILHTFTLVHTWYEKSTSQGHTNHKLGVYVNLNKSNLIRSYNNVLFQMTTLT